jgi:hypothetical protein
MRSSGERCRGGALASGRIAAGATSTNACTCSGCWISSEGTFNINRITHHMLKGVGQLSHFSYLFVI